MNKRLANWYAKPNMRTVIVKRVKVSNQVNHSIHCLFCLLPTSVLTSVKARVNTKIGHTQIMNPSSINNPTEYITTTGSMLHVDTVKNVSYQETKTGRVCDKCKSKLTLSEILPELDDRKVEVYTDHSRLGFGKGND